MLTEVNQFPDAYLAIIHGYIKKEAHEYIFTTHPLGTEKEALDTINEELQRWWIIFSEQARSNGEKWEIFSTSMSDGQHRGTKRCPSFKDFRKMPKVFANGSRYWFKVLIGPEAAADRFYGR